MVAGGEYNATAFAQVVKQVQQLQQEKAQLQSDLDGTWVLVVCAFIFMMQAGFAFLEAGTVQDKNVRTILLKNMVDFSMSTIFYWLLGFPLQHRVTGNDHGASWFIGGTEGWLIQGTDEMVTFFFQLLFASTTTTIVSGAVASRITFWAYILAGIVMASVVHPVVAHWIWQGGWLGQGDWKVIDFAGGIPVHVVGGTFAIVGALMVGPRTGRFARDASGRRVEGKLKKHSVVLAATGCFFLWIGWNGFNPGSTGAASHGRILVSGHAAVTTSLASAASVVVYVCALGVLQGLGSPVDFPSSLLLSTFLDGVHSLWQILNGVLAGLVAITPACATVEPWAALLIGALASVVVRFASSVVFRLGLAMGTACSLIAAAVSSPSVDDVVDAFAVHCACGLLGSLCTAVMSTQDLIDRLYGPGVIDYDPGRQLGVHCVANLAGVALTLLLALATFGCMAACKGLRVSEEDELTGLDFKYHAGYHYQTFAEQVKEAQENERVKRRVSMIVLDRRRKREQDGKRNVLNPLVSMLHSPDARAHVDPAAAKSEGGDTGTSSSRRRRSSKKSSGRSTSGRARGTGRLSAVPESKPRASATGRNAPQAMPSAGTAASSSVV